MNKVYKWTGREELAAEETDLNEGKGHGKGNESPLSVLSQREPKGSDFFQSVPFRMFLKSQIYRQSSQLP